jgi:hypothetical protein
MNYESLETTISSLSFDFSSFVMEIESVVAIKDSFSIAKHHFGISNSNTLKFFSFIDCRLNN